MAAPLDSLFTDLKPGVFAFDECNDVFWVYGSDNTWHEAGAGGGGGPTTTNLEAFSASFSSAVSIPDNTRTTYIPGGLGWSQEFASPSTDMTFTGVFFEAISLKVFSSCLYHVSADVRFTENATGSRLLEIVTQSNRTLCGNTMPAVDTGSNFDLHNVNVSQQVLINSGDSIHLVVAQNSGGALDVVEARLSVSVVAVV